MERDSKKTLKYGRWASDIHDGADKYKIIFESPPENEIESVQYGNALADTGNYPIGLNGCFSVGLSGGCGLDCYVYKEGRCESPDGMVDGLDENDERVLKHKEMYG